MEFLNIPGNVASMVGLGITIWVWFRVGSIQRGFLKQAILPPRMRVLEGRVRNLEQAIQTKNRQSASQELERCRSLLRASREYLEGHRRESCEQTADMIERVRQLPAGVQFWRECERIRSRLHGVHEDLKTLVKELEWRTKDAN